MGNPRERALAEKEEGEIDKGRGLRPSEPSAAKRPGYIASARAWPKALHLISVAPSMRRAKS